MSEFWWAILGFSVAAVVILYAAIIMSKLREDDED